VARPKRRGAFIGPSLHDDPKFVALGRCGKLGLFAQVLLPLLKAVMDDQGRSPADVDWVWSKAANGVGGLTLKTLPAVVELYGKALGHDGAWAILYESEGRPFIQWIDAEGDLEGLRYREPSKYPAPPDWQPDEVRSWQDDPFARGSKAWHEKRIRERDKNGTGDHPHTDDARNREPSARDGDEDVTGTRRGRGRETPKPPSAHALKNGPQRVGQVPALASRIPA
jgi:hypothetical protein